MFLLGLSRTRVRLCRRLPLPGQGGGTASVGHLLTVFALLVTANTAGAQTMPLLDTDDSSLSEAAVTEGRIHPLAQIGLGNGDFSRGAYDGDAADLDRLPYQTQLAIGAELAHGADGKPTLWLEGVTTNNFHAPHADETASPRAWYDNNNLVGLIAEPLPGLRGALTYVIKTAPNGFASTVHEANASVIYAGDGLLGSIRPAAVVTMHPHGGHGVYTQVGITPAWHLTGGSGGPTLSLPVKAGVGWSGFYGADTDDAAYGAVGLAYTHPVSIRGVKAAFHASASALIRSDPVARQGDFEAEHGTVVPLVSIGFSVAQ